MDALKEPLPRFLAKCVAILLAIALSRAGAMAADPRLDSPELERSVKAAFLYKFLSYVEWREPKFPQPDSPVVIGVVGAPELAADLTGIVRDRTVNGRPIQVRILSEGASVSSVHAVFVGPSASARLRDIAAAAQEYSVLVVTDTPDGLDRGGVINFVLDEDGHIRFEVSLAAAESSGLRVSSRMLSVAKSVRPGPSR